MERNVMGRIHSVETFGTLDGPGVRYVLFFQGCPLRCLYCHNPDSWTPKGGKVIGSKQAVKDIMTYYNFIKNGGVTLSGGEPLLQPEFALSIIENCHQASIKRGKKLNVALDTSGAIPIISSKPVIDAADMLLLDVKASEPELYQQLTGGNLQNTIDTLNYCQSINKPLWIRHVLVPEITLDDRQLNKLGKLLSKYSCIEKVEILPFHKMGEYKWEQLKMQYTLEYTPESSFEEVEHAINILKSFDLNVT